MMRTHVLPPRARPRRDHNLSRTPKGAHAMKTILLFLCAVAATSCGGLTLAECQARCAEVHSCVYAFESVNEICTCFGCGK